MKKSGFVEVGVIKPEKHDDSELTTAYIASIHEFGATINHPGGTPYIIGEGGKAIFVKKGTLNVAGVTKPHKIIIPERSFMRSTLREQKSAIRKMSKLLLKNVVNGKTTSKIALGEIGLYTADKISRKIVAIRTPENKSATVRRKGASNPLVATGQLKNSITYKVTDGKLR